MFRRITLLAVLLIQASFAQTPAPSQAPPAITHPVSLDKLFSELDIVHAAISTSGRYLAVVVHRTADDVLLVMDLQTTRER